jgi:hypothetical protein
VSVLVHSFTLSYTPGRMKYDSQAFFLALTFASLCFGRKPKARVTTFYFLFFLFFETLNFKFQLLETICLENQSMIPKCFLKMV